jgi:cysteine desulfurase/selenocysteine lyase
MTSFNAKRIRDDIPQLRRHIGGYPLTYLDSAASSLPPHAVIDAMSRYYELRHTNVHRAVYQTAVEATQAYESARAGVANFIKAPGGAEEVVFSKNTTESINLIAKSWGAANLKPGDVVLLSELEHHSNIVPWFQLRDALGVTVRFIPVTETGILDLSNLDELLAGAKLVSLTAMSNTTGAITPVVALVEAAHKAGALIAIDGAQAIIHAPMDVTALGIDFLAFSGHKMLGPTGIGVLWARQEILEAMPPFLTGGGMIIDVRTDGYTPASGVARFEAGTPPIAEAVGLGAAVRYLEGLGMDNVAAHDHHLTKDALERLQGLSERIRVVGPLGAADRGGVISLVIDGAHPHDVSQILDSRGICVRAGHHCTKPLMHRLGVAATTRISFGPYSLTSDTDALIEGLGHVLRIF